MKASTKARLKIVGGYVSLLNAGASCVGVGLLTVLSRNHGATTQAIAHATHTCRAATARIKEGEAELAEAKRRGE